jgi:hypothetical protein
MADNVTTEKQSAELSNDGSDNGVSRSRYKQIETIPEIIMSSSKSIMYPVATLADESGGVCQIINDDHCYVLCLCQEDGAYKSTNYIFKEAFNVLKNLPEPA